MKRYQIFSLQSFTLVLLILIHLCSTDETGNECEQYLDRDLNSDDRNFTKQECDDKCDQNMDGICCVALFWTDEGSNSTLCELRGFETDPKTPPQSNMTCTATPNNQTACQPACAKNLDVQNGRADFDEAVRYVAGEEVVVTCNFKYHVEGKPTREQQLECKNPGADDEWAEPTNCVKGCDEIGNSLVKKNLKIDGPFDKLPVNKDLRQQGDSVNVSCVRDHDWDGYAGTTREFFCRNGGWFDADQQSLDYARCGKKCDVADLKIPPDHTRGDNKTKFDQNEHLELTCPDGKYVWETRGGESGTEPPNKQTIQCAVNGWEKNVQECIKVCQYKHTFDNNIQNQYNNWIKIGHSLNLECEESFGYKEGDQFKKEQTISCSANGWDPQLKPCIKGCESNFPSYNNENLEHVINELHAPNKQIDVKCLDGYYVSGTKPPKTSQTLKCGNSGRWDPDEPKSCKQGCKTSELPTGNEQLNLKPPKFTNDDLVNLNQQLAAPFAKVTMNCKSPSFAWNSKHLRQSHCTDVEQACKSIELKCSHEGGLWGGEERVNINDLECKPSCEQVSPNIVPLKYKVIVGDRGIVLKCREGFVIKGAKDDEVTSKKVWCKMRSKSARWSTNVECVKAFIAASPSLVWLYVIVVVVVLFVLAAAGGACLYFTYYRHEKGRAEEREKERLEDENRRIAMRAEKDLRLLREARPPAEGGRAPHSEWDVKGFSDLSSDRLQDVEVPQQHKLSPIPPALTPPPKPKNPEKQDKSLHVEFTGIEAHAIEGRSKDRFLSEYGYDRRRDNMTVKQPKKPDQQADEDSDYDRKHDDEETDK